MYLIDTNIISEVRKGRRCDSERGRLVSSYPRRRTFPQVQVIGEIRQGIERLRPRNARQAAALENWLEEILGHSASEYDRLANESRRAGSPQCARRSTRRRFAHGRDREAHHLTLVTRNLKDLERRGVRCLNPFEPAEASE